MEAREYSATLRVPTEHLWEYVAVVRPSVEQALLYHLPVGPDPSHELLNNALRDAVFPGGKRWRPILTLLAAELVGGERCKVLSAAVAIEFLHTSSLIIDDLPCMDNAVERRHRPALHLSYGEALAVLAALTLMNASYGLIMEGTSNGTLARVVHREFVNSLGVCGLIGGQLLDLGANGVIESCNRSGPVRGLKTSPLIRLALKSGAIISSGSDKQVSVLARFGDLLGEAYQIGDDVIDTNEDRIHFRNAGLKRNLPMETTDPEVAQLIRTAKDLLVEEFGNMDAAIVLCELAEHVLQRERQNLNAQPRN